MTLCPTNQILYAWTDTGRQCLSQSECIDIYSWQLGQEFIPVYNFRSYWQFSAFCAYILFELKQWTYYEEITYTPLCCSGVAYAKGDNPYSHTWTTKKALISIMWKKTVFFKSVTFRTVVVWSWLSFGMNHITQFSVLFCRSLMCGALRKCGLAVH